MDKLQEAPRSETLAEQVQRSMRKTLEKVGFIGYLPQGSSEKKIAILGAGAAVEVPVIDKLFVDNGLGRPKVVCFDKDPSFKKLTEELVRSQGLNLEYHSRDISDPNSFEGEQYDMVIIRNPDVHSLQGKWSDAFKNGFNHLKPGGIFLATTDIYADIVRLELQKGGEVVKKYSIPEIDRVSPNFNENDLFIARKGS